MGIHGLTKLLGEVAPGCMKENAVKDHFGRKIAIDASMCLYQFLVAIRSGMGPEGGLLTNADGEITSHLQGMFSRTVRLMEQGIKPVYVFDGKPPQLKSSELAKRRERREEAKAELEKAKEAGDAEAEMKFQKRTVTLSRDQVEDTKKLLRLMGVPVVEAPCEAEAQCAELCKKKRVWATASEDMDALTFGTPVLLRRLLSSEARKLPVIELHTDVVLRELGFTEDQFIDLCILLGCDYSDTIRGVGPKTAFKLMKEHGSLEAVIKFITEGEGKGKYTMPEDFPYDVVRGLFKAPEVADGDAVEIKFGEPDVAALKQFLVTEKGFSEARVDSGIAKLKTRDKMTQNRLESFFGAAAAPASGTPKKRDAPAGRGGKGAPASAAKRGAPVKRGGAK